MIKAATIPLGLTLLLASISVSSAQAPAQETAVNEAIYRQASRITLRQRIADAQKAQQRGELAAAAKLYDDSWELVQKIGSGVEDEAAQTKAGLSEVRLDLARGAQRRGDLREAKTQIADVLRVDPSNAAAQDFYRGNEKLLRESQGKLPSEEIQAQVPPAMAAKAKTSTKVQDAKLLYEMGKLDEAEVKIKQAIAEDPSNQSAYYYNNLIQNRKYKEAANKRAVDGLESMVTVEKEWEKPVKREALPVPNPYASNKLIYTGSGRQAILNKLDTLYLDEVGPWENLPLSEVVKILSDQSKKRDPQKGGGINFIINPNAEATAAIQTTGAIDPTTGLAVQTTAPAEQVDMSGIPIKISPAISRVRFADALDAIVKVANPPIKYSIEDYAVVFSAKGRDVAPLFVRTFRVDPNTFYQGLEGVSAFVFGETDTGSSGGGGGGGRGGGGGGGGGGRSGGGGGQSGNTVSGAIVPRVDVAGGGISGGGGGGGGRSGGGGGGIGGGGGGGGQGGGLRFITRTNSMSEVNEAARNFFQGMGVDLTPPKNLFFNDRQGTLFVRATMQDLDVIEAAIQVLNIAAPQINVKAKFVEISQDDNKALGFDWYLGNISMNNGTIGGQGGTAPSMNGAPSSANPSGVFPGNATAGTTIAPSTSDQLVTKGLRNSTDSLFTLTGILTDPQFRMVIHAIDQRSGSDILSAPEVTTLSGRQAQMKATEIKTVIIDFEYDQSVSGTTTTGGQ